MVMLILKIRYDIDHNHIDIPVPCTRDGRIRLGPEYPTIKFKQCEEPVKPR